MCVSGLVLCLVCVCVCCDGEPAGYRQNREAISVRRRGSGELMHVVPLGLGGQGTWSLGDQEILSVAKGVVQMSGLLVSGSGTFWAGYWLTGWLVV